MHYIDYFQTSMTATQQYSLLLLVAINSDTQAIHVPYVVFLQPMGKTCESALHASLDTCWKQFCDLNFQSQYSISLLHEFQNKKM